MEKVQHPNIIRLYEVIETLTKLHLVIEYASGGELFAKISNEGKISEKTAKRLYAQVVSAVEHMVRLIIPLGSFTPRNTSLLNVDSGIVLKH